MSTLDARELVVDLDADAGIVRALDGVRLCIGRGETFALVGESGCGKSMTALALLRLLPENGRVSAGQVLLDGQDLLALPERAMRGVRGARIGMIFQEPATSLNPVMRIGAQVLEAIEAHTPLRGAAARAKAVEWLGRVGIAQAEERIDDYPFQLSGGQKQRVMIAMALAAEPDFLLADEPTTALDASTQAQILELLRRLQREQRLGLLLITHDLGLVAGMAQRVALMYAGQIIEVAPAEAFFAAPLHPYARALLQALPDATRRGRPLQAIAGSVPPLSSAFQGCRFAPRCGQAMPACTATAPALIEHGAQRHVRCLLYAPAVPVPAWPVAAAPVSEPAPPSAPESATDAAARVPAVAAAAPVAAPALLQVRGLGVSFVARRSPLRRAGGGVVAVRDVSFELRRGRTLALVGESGCGKTSTGKAIVQLLRGQAQVTGEALLEGRNLFELQGPALLAARREVQIVFQDPFASLNPRLRVAELLAEGLEALHPQLGAEERRARIESLTERVGLAPDALQRFPHEFSGGQRQRIAIARALAVQPKLLVCDEPTSALDVSVQAQILNLLRELQRDMGLSYLFITHNIGVVEYIADTVAVMRAGRIVEQGPCEAVLRQPQQAYTRELLAAVPRVGVLA